MLLYHAVTGKSRTPRQPPPSPEHTGTLTHRQTRKHESQEIPLYSVHLTIPRSGGWHEWRTVSGRYEEQLGAQESPTVIGPHIEREVRGRPDYVRVIISVAVDAPDIAQALTAA